MLTMIFCLEAVYFDSNNDWANKLYIIILVFFFFLQGLTGNIFPLCFIDNEY